MQSAWTKPMRGSWKMFDIAAASKRSKTSLLKQVDFNLKLLDTAEKRLEADRLA